MTTDEIIAAAREAGFGPRTIAATIGQLTRFAQLVRDDALEEAIEIVAFNGGSIQIEAHLRQLKGKT